MENIYIDKKELLMYYKRNRDKNENLLWHIRRKVDLMIEPYGFTVEDF